MGRSTRTLLVLSFAAFLHGCGWAEERKAEAERRALGDAAVAAAKAGDVTTLKELLAKEPAVANAIEREPRRKGPPAEVGTALTAAVSSGKPEAVELLLESGADPNGSGTDRRETALHAVAKLDVPDGSELRIAGLLLARGGRLDLRESALGHTPVHALLNRGGDEAPRLPLLRLFLSRPGSAEVRDGDGRTPLHFAAAFRQSLNLGELLVSGADPNAKVPTTERLVGAEQIDGDTPLHFAARSSRDGGRADGIVPLCAFGADPSIANAAGKTPADVARGVLREEKARGTGVEGRVRATERVLAALAPGGPCEVWLARFRANGRPASTAPARLAEREFNCAAGDYLHCEELGAVYEKGDGVPRDLARALSAFEGGCEARSGWACAKAGTYHRAGTTVPPDALAAIRFFERGCDYGSAWSCNVLGEVVRDGEVLPRDPARALSLFEKACQKGSAAGCANGRALKAAGL